VTRSEAKAALASGEPISYSSLDDILRAFDCVTKSPDFATEVYYHKDARCAKVCKQFTARDDGIHVLLPEQIDAVIWLIACIERWEKANP
jgi:hypothetical protein